MVLSKKAYDALKYFAQIVIPAIGTLYFALSQIWGLAHGPEVVGTLTAVDTFLGVLLGIAMASYNNSDAPYDGSVVVTPSPGDDTPMKVSLELNNDVTNLKNGDVLSFKVSGP